MPIKWRVLRRDCDALLVISEYGLDAKPYNDKNCAVTWADCTLRRWLNGEFLQKAFSAQEQSLIKTSKLTNNAGSATEDRVFLLSVDEAKSLFADDGMGGFFKSLFGNPSIDRQARATGYAIKKGVWTNNDRWAWWWLRSRGIYDSYAAGVRADGSVSYLICDNVDNASGSVRPAFRIAI